MREVVKSDRAIKLWTSFEVDGDMRLVRERERDEIHLLGWREEAGENSKSQTDEINNLLRRTRED